MKRFLFPFLLVLSSCSLKPIEIIPLKELTEIDTLKHDGIMSTYKTDYFLVKNYLTSDFNDAVNNFIDSHFDSSSLGFNQYDMKFYKESKSLNLDLIKKLSNKHKAVEDEKPIKTFSWFDRKLLSH